MSKKQHEWNIANSLDNYINKEVAKRMLANGGVKVRKMDIVNEVARFSNVGFENINRIKRGLCTPSLPVSMRIAEYFNVKVEDIFKIY